MINLSALKNITNTPMKVLASNKFVQSMANVDSGSLEERQAVVRNQGNKLDFRYKIIFEQGIHALKRFSEKPELDHELLKVAAGKFFEALEIKKNKAEPYFYLSYIFNYFGKKEEALNYLKVALNINPNIEGKDLLIKQISEVETKEQPEASKMDTVKGQDTNNSIKRSEPAQGEVKFKPEAMVIRRSPNYSKY